MLLAINSYASDAGEHYQPQSGHPAQNGVLFSTTAPIWEYVSRRITDCPTLLSPYSVSKIKTAIVCGDTAFSTYGCGCHPTSFSATTRYYSTRRRGMYEGVKTFGPAETPTQRVLTTDLFTGYNGTSNYFDFQPEQKGAHDCRGVNTGFEDGHVGWIGNRLSTYPISYDMTLAITDKFYYTHWNQSLLVGWNEK